MITFLQCLEESVFIIFSHLMRRPTLPLHVMRLFPLGVLKVCSLPLVICSGFAVQEVKKRKLEVLGLHWETVCFPTQRFLCHFARLEGRLVWPFSRSRRLPGLSLLPDFRPGHDSCPSQHVPRFGVCWTLPFPAAPEYLFSPDKNRSSISGSRVLKDWPSVV